jgi:hypothetical protein
MSRRLALLAAALLASPAFAIDDALLAQCAAVADAEARLACYDALARRPAAADRAPGSAAPDAPSAAAAPPAAAAVPSPAPGDFGLPRPRAPEERTGITARIDGPLKEWKPGTRFRLDNGQVWTAVDQESGYYPGIPDNAEVTIKQSFFGAYWMEIKAVGRKVKVKRVS